MEDLTNIIDAGLYHNAEYLSMPDSGHSECTVTLMGFQYCKDWFNELVGE